MLVRIRKFIEVFPTSKCKRKIHVFKKTTLNADSSSNEN
jgi:hypothetical protein